MLNSSAGRAVLISFVVASLADAQGSSGATELARRSSANLAAMQSRPQGAFGDNVVRGYGLDGAYQLRLDDSGFWSVRVSAGIISYGDESRRTALSESVGGRVLVDVKTSNYIVPMSVGPQLTWPTGSFRPYVNVGLGGQAFFTESHLEGTGDRTPFATTTNHSSFAASWVAGGGIYLPVYRGKTKVHLDLGVQYLGGGRTRYLTAGSITDMPGAQTTIAPVESATHMVIVRFGARVGL